MKILHISSIYNIKSNGVAVALSSYLTNEIKYEDVAIYNLKTDIKVDNVKYFNYKNYNSILSLPDGYNKPDLVVFNEIYKKQYIKIYKECLKNNIPYIIIPHGCLVKKAQNKKRFKKILGNILLFDRFIKNAKCIQFLNENEKNESIIKNKNYIISGNGINKPNYINNYTNKNLVYIGRYDINTKGLDLLVNMCKDNKNWFIKNNIKIELYGRDTNNNKEKLKNLIDKNDLKNIIILNDEIYNEQKETILKNSYVFIQVSRHEGQPIGIIEALSIGLPCIVTHQTNIGDFINKYNCGIVVSTKEEEIFEAIKKVYSNDNLRNEFSKNAYKYTNEVYNFDVISKDCIEKYKDIIKR